MELVVTSSYSSVSGRAETYSSLPRLTVIKIDRLPRPIAAPRVLFAVSRFHRPRVSALVKLPQYNGVLRNPVHPFDQQLLLTPASIEGAED